MSIVDHEQKVTVNFGISMVFEALLKAIPNVAGMQIENANNITNTITIKAGVSLFSWGENITIALEEITENKTNISVLSTPKTGLLFGGAMDMGKNRKNINLILNEMSNYLK